LSAIAEPPKPRLITGTPGKSRGNVVHIRIEELPTNSTPCCGGGCSPSFATSSSMSACQCCGGGGLACTPLLNRSNKASMNHPLGEPRFAMPFFAVHLIRSKIKITIHLRQRSRCLMLAHSPMGTRRPGHYDDDRTIAVIRRAVHITLSGLLLAAPIPLISFAATRSTITMGNAD